MNISLREITYILAIAEEGSITKAAGKLFIAQPSLSQAVKRIESDLGTPLFSRIKGGLALTEAGTYFVESPPNWNRISRIFRSCRAVPSAWGPPITWGHTWFRNCFPSSENSTLWSASP